MHRDLRPRSRPRPAALGRRLPGSRVTRLRLITGVADHDVYHAGQIQLLKKLYRSAAPVADVPGGYIERGGGVWLPGALPPPLSSARPSSATCGRRCCRPSPPVRRDHHGRGRRRRRAPPRLLLSAIRTDRPRRFGTLGLAAALAVVSFAALRSGDAKLTVEAFHFVEYGVLTLLFFPFGRPGARWEAYVEAALARTAVGVADEWFQWFVPGRVGEWHDVLFNLLATACGLLLCLALDSRQGLTWGRVSDLPDRRATRSACARRSSSCWSARSSPPFISAARFAIRASAPSDHGSRPRACTSSARSARAAGRVGRRPLQGATAARISTKPKRSGTCAAATSAWTAIARATPPSSTSRGTRT